jgi:hypothetical protein
MKYILDSNPHKDVTKKLSEYFSRYRCTKIRQILAMWV